MVLRKSVTLTGKWKVTLLENCRIFAFITLWFEAIIDKPEAACFITGQMQDQSVFVREFLLCFTFHLSPCVTLKHVHDLCGLACVLSSPRGCHTLHSRKSRQKILSSRANFIILDNSIVSLSPASLSWELFFAPPLFRYNSCASIWCWPCHKSGIKVLKAIQ